MQIGRFDTRLTIIKSRTIIGNQPAFLHGGKCWARIVDAKAAGRESNATIYSAVSSLVETPYRSDLGVGYLLRGAGGWLVIEDLTRIGGVLQMSCRRLVGEPATYITGSGDSYPVTAYLAQEGAVLGALPELRSAIDLIQPELAWPWCRRGDQIELRGKRHRIEAIAESSDNGITVRVQVV